MPLDRDRIAAACGRLRFLRLVELAPEVDSTNTALGDLAREGAARDGAVFLAEHQTAGRGRAGRTWTSAPRSDILMSVLLRPDIPPEAYPTLTFHVGLAVALALDSLCGPALRLKWPNDLLLEGAKLGGILAEASLPAGGTAGHVVVGLGLNVHGDPSERGISLSHAATSLAAFLGTRPDRTEVLLTILEALDRQRPAMELGRVPASAWTKRAAWLGQEVTLREGRGELRGTMLGVGPDGALRLGTAAGEKVVRSGDLLRVVGGAGE